MRMKPARLKALRRGARAALLTVGAAALMATSLVLPMAPEADAADTAMSVVQGTVEPALKVLANKQIPVQQRRDQLKAIIARSFDFTEMSRSALGYHWRQLTQQQQSEFTNVFTTFIEDAYLAKINDYSGQKVQYIKTANDGPQYAQVFTNIVQPNGGNPISVNYRLIDRNGDWKIYDVTVDAISIIANYRNQFNRVMNNQGYSTLINDLKSKQAGLAASLGNE